MKEITIVTVNWFCAEMIADLLTNLQAKAENPHQLQFLVVDNTHGRDKDLNSVNSQFYSCEILTVDPGRCKGSRGHAFALNQAMPHIKTEYCLIVDPDVYVFRKGWDQLCIQYLAEQNYVAIGAPYPDWKVGRYHDFPSPPFCFFKTGELMELEPDWRPYCDTLWGNLRAFFCRQIGRLVFLVNRKRHERCIFCRSYASWAEKTFGVFSQDTGWRIARNARQAGKQSFLFDLINPQQLPKTMISQALLKSLAGEYELYYINDEPFLTHKYGTGGWLWRTQRGHDHLYWKHCIVEMERACID